MEPYSSQTRLSGQGKIFTIICMDSYILYLLYSEEPLSPEPQLPGQEVISYTYLKRLASEIFWGFGGNFQHIPGYIRIVLACYLHLCWGHPRH